MPSMPYTPNSAVWPCSAGPGEVIGEHAFLTGERPDYYVEALGDTTLCTFEHDDLARVVAGYPAISLGLLRALSDRLDAAERRLTRTSREVPARLASYLLELPATLRPDGTASVSWTIPKKDVAALLGTTPESLSRALASLKRRGLIAGSTEVTLLDADALEALADG